MLFILSFSLSLSLSNVALQDNLPTKCGKRTHTGRFPFTRNVFPVFWMLLVGDRDDDGDGGKYEQRRRSVWRHLNKHTHTHGDPSQTWGFCCPSHHRWKSQDTADHHTRPSRAESNTTESDRVLLNVLKSFTTSFSFRMISRVAPSSSRQTKHFIDGRSVDEQMWQLLTLFNQLKLDKPRMMGDDDGDDNKWWSSNTKQAHLMWSLVFVRLNLWRRLWRLGAEEDNGG